LELRGHLIYKLRYKYFRFGGRHVVVRTSGYTLERHAVTIELLVLRTGGLAFAILILSGLEPKTVLEVILHPPPCSGTGVKNTELHRLEL
jgi:hypothetical protein